MKKNILKVMFYLSLLPYIYILLKAIYCSICGIEIISLVPMPFVETTIGYGLEAFIEVIVWTTVKFIKYYIIQICIIFQIIYFANLDNKKTRKEK